jgi:hypothetical protein
MKDSQAALNQLSNGVVRVDLHKQYLPHQEITALDLSEELDSEIQL